MREVILYVPTISCGHCKASILEGLKKVRGVSKASVEVDSKTVEVTLSAKTPVKAVVEAIEARNHKVATIAE